MRYDGSARVIVGECVGSGGERNNVQGAQLGLLARCAACVNNISDLPDESGYINFNREHAVDSPPVSPVSDFSCYPVTPTK